MRIEIQPHGRQPLGDYAVIKIIGISQLEGDATFWLTPVAERAGSAQAGLAGRALLPLGVRTSADAVELLIGPDIVRAAELKTGTLAHFRMPSAGADMQVRWPALGQREAVPPPLPAHLREAMRETVHAHVVTSPVAASAAAKPTAATQVQLDPKLEADKGLARLKPRTSAVPPPHAPAMPPIESQNAAAPPPLIASAAAAPPLQTSAAAPMPPHTAASAPLLPQHVAAQPVSAYSGWRERIEAENRAKQAAGQAPGSARAWFVAGVPVTLGLVIIAGLFVWIMRTVPVEGAGMLFFSASPVVTAGSSTRVNGAEAHASSLITEIIKAGARSPTGTDATNVSDRQALARADKLLRDAPTPEARAEAAFWLRRALARSLARPQLIWAVTQLGTAFAASGDPAAKPDYAAARLLWHWASDAGDAQAACFLGRLDELGLGGPVDAERARQHYSHARLLGGCPGLDQALLRVGN